MVGERISPSQILAEAGADKTVTAPTFLQPTGSLLAASVCTLGAMIILLLVIGWMHSAPAAPIIPPALTAPLPSYIFGSRSSSKDQ
jgi:hypothetical protein